MEEKKLKKRLEEAILTLKTLREDAEMALNGDWDRGDVGFRDQIILIDQTIEYINPERKEIDHEADDYDRSADYWKLVMVNRGTKKLHLIKFLKEFFDLGLKEAKEEWVDPECPRELPEYLYTYKKVKEFMKGITEETDADIEAIPITNKEKNDGTH